MVKPEDQFQIGESVIYIPEGILTRVTGYLWMSRIGGPPEISAYKLDCGISTVKKYLERI